MTAKKEQFNKEQFEKEREQLMKTIDKYKADIEQLKSKTIDENKFVPKQKLKEETIIERLNWWYKDLESTKNKLLANIVSFGTILLMSVGVYFGIFSIESVTSLTEGLGGIFATVGSVITTILGLLLQSKALKTPKQS